MTATILVVDDDPAIRASLSSELRAAGYEVLQAGDGAEAARIAVLSAPDLVVTDLAMPRADGFALVSKLRASGATPVIVISVRGGDDDKIRALDLGADDFVTKPFSMPELLARVRAQLRRATPGSGERFTFDGLVVDVASARVTLEGREVKLTPTERALLELFARNAGRPLTFDQIIARVWKTPAGTTRDTVRVHVGSLRRKIEPDPSNPRYLVTEPWIGFRFIAEPR